MEYTWQYYDLLLFSIFASAIVGAGVGTFTPVSLPVAAIATSLVAVALIGHRPFVNEPVDEPRDLAEPVGALN